MLLRSRLRIVSLRIVSLSLILLAPTLLLAQLSEDSPLHTATQQELDVIKVILKQQSAWNDGDLAAFVQAYKDSPQTLFITHQVSHGYAGLLDEYKHDYPNKASMGTLAYSDLEVQPLDANYAVVIGKYHLDRSKKDGGSAEGLFSLVFEKTDKGWKIIIDHTT